ncbi:TonB-dependent receptor [Horticoccus luteus]|uniref:TonB-dependent receptor n=1 Tax=Horticoccus luteus TaxID=2862869 RepID=A0A8F9XFU8_9BACT|nr:TonB-dependent receptor [Horticoccus luteus]QYM78472.1 TonB-dependent receptor [Horticoccus luteus]
MLDPVLVTADLWSSPLDRMSASVTVIDDATLRAGAVQHLGDVANEIPNLTWTGGTSRPRYFQIRGIGENSQYEGETPDSAVRFLVDDLDFTGLGGIGSTFDVQQVEVLRGPQAGAFGANAAGGVIRLVTHAPTPFWTGFVHGSVGSDDLRTGGFALGGPLDAGRPDQLMMRLAVEQSKSDGFRHNVFLNRDTNARDEFTARLRLTYNPNPLWRWDTAVVWADLNNGFDEFALDNNGRFTYSDQPGRDVQRSLAGSVRGTFSGWPDVRLTTITNAVRTRSIYSYDDDWTSASYASFSDDRRLRNVFNQELRLDSAVAKGALGWIDRWTLGAFFARLDETSHYTDTSAYEISGLDTRYRADNTALFGQIAHDFTSQTRVIVGLRVEGIDLRGGGVKTKFDPIAGTSAPPIALNPRFDVTMFGGKLTIEHDLSPRAVVFASVTRGYKAGGINVDARIDPTADPLTYGTETLWNYEAGWRGHSVDQRLRGELTVFYLDRHATQVRDSAGFGGSYRFFTDNGQRAHVTGAEATATYRMTAMWSVRGTLALMDSELEPFVLSNGNAGGGRRLANTPAYGFTVGAHYGASRGVFGDVDLLGRASQYDSNDQDQQRRAYHLVNASVGYVWRDWTFTVWAKNLFDERYEKRVFFFGNEDPDYIETRYEDRADPRQVGATATYRF